MMRIGEHHINKDVVVTLRVEAGETEKIFTEPDNPMTWKYVTGDFG